MFLDRFRTYDKLAKFSQESVVRGVHRERYRGSANTKTPSIRKQWWPRDNLCTPRAGHRHKVLQIWPGVWHILQKMSQITFPLRGSPYASISSAIEKEISGKNWKGNYHIHGGHWKGIGKAPLSSNILHRAHSYLIQINTTTDHGGGQEEHTSEGSGGDKKDTK